MSHGFELFNPTEGGDLTNHYTKTEVDDLLNNALGDYFTKEQINNLIANLPTADLSDYYTKSEVDNLISSGGVDLSNYYNKTQVDNLINGLSQAISSLTQEVNNLTKEVDDLKQSLSPQRSTLTGSNWINSRFLSDQSVIKVTEIAGGLVFLEGYFEVNISTLTSNGGLFIALRGGIHPHEEQKLQVAITGNYRNNQGTHTTESRSFTAKLRTDGIAIVEGQIVMPQNSSNEFGKPIARFSTSYAI